MSEVCTLEVGDDGCARLAGQLTFESVTGLFREAEKLFRAGSAVSTIDLSGIINADSAGLSLLLEWQAIQSPTARKLSITNSPENLISLARLCEAVELLGISGRKPQQ